MHPDSWIIGVIAYWVGGNGVADIHRRTGRLIAAASQYKQDRNGRRKRSMQKGHLEIQPHRELHLP